MGKGRAVVTNYTSSVRIFAGPATALLAVRIFAGSATALLAVRIFAGPATAFLAVRIFAGPGTTLLAVRIFVGSATALLSEYLQGQLQPYCQNICRASCNSFLSKLSSLPRFFPAQCTVLHVTCIGIPTFLLHRASCLKKLNFRPVLRRCSVPVSTRFLLFPLVPKNIKAMP
jgi:hypothetical protein